VWQSCNIKHALAWQLIAYHLSQSAK